MAPALAVTRSDSLHADDRRRWESRRRGASGAEPRRDPRAGIGSTWIDCALSLILLYTVDSSPSIRCLHHTNTVNTASKLNGSPPFEPGCATPNRRPKTPPDTDEPTAPRSSPRPPRRPPASPNRAARRRPQTRPARWSPAETARASPARSPAVLPSLRKSGPASRNPFSSRSMHGGKPGRHRRRADKHEQRDGRHFDLARRPAQAAPPPGARRRWPPAPASAPPPQYSMFEQSHRLSISTWWPKVHRRAPAWSPWWHIWQSAGLPGRRSWRRPP